jgi:hypothetical protein
MKCQVQRPKGVVALQGQFLARPRLVMGDGAWALRGGAMVDLWLPRVRVGYRGVRSGVDAHENRGTSIACNRTPRCRGEAKNWPYRPNGTIAPGSRDCIPGWWNWPYRPQSQGRRCAFAQIMLRPSSKVTTHSRFGAIVDLWLPRVRVGCRGVRSGVDAHENRGTSIACNRTPRCRGEAKTWPYRPKGTIGPGSRDCIPGWWNWPYRPQSQGRRRVFACILRRPSSKVTTHSRFGAMHVSGLHASGLCAFTAAAPLAVLVHLQPTRVSGL